MKIKKSLLALATASAVTLGGAPVAFAAESAPADTTAATEAPAASSETPAGSSDESTTGETSGSSEEQKAELQGSVDKTFGWDENTTGLQKFQTIFDFVVKIVKTALGIPSLGSSN